MTAKNCECGHERRDHQRALGSSHSGTCKVCLCNQYVRLKPASLAAQRTSDILLVDNNESSRKHRALMLATHGYGVDTISALSGLGGPWEDAKYRLVLLGIGLGTNAEMEAWKKIQRNCPSQRFMFLLNVSERLCPLFLDDDQIRDEESPNSFLQRVESALTLGSS